MIHKIMAVIIFLLIVALLAVYFLMTQVSQENRLLRITAKEAIEANKSLELSIIELSKQISIAEEVNKKSEENRKYLNRQLRNSKQQITDLGESNETIENYLNTPIPDELFDLLRKGSNNHKGNGAEGKATIKLTVIN